MEVSPIYDVSGMTAITGANLLFEMLCVLPGVHHIQPDVWKKNHAYYNVLRTIFTNKEAEIYANQSLFGDSLAVFIQKAVRKNRLFAT